MRVHLVVWSECDSGFEIKSAFADEERAKAEAKRLNDADKALLIADTERWIKEVTPNAVIRIYRGDHGEALSYSAAIAAARREAKRSASHLCQHHEVISIDVQ